MKNEKFKREEMYKSLKLNPGTQFKKRLKQYGTSFHIYCIKCILYFHHDFSGLIQYFISK